MSLINEAFKELKGIDLDEELFSFDEKGARDLSYFLDNTSDPVLDVVDPLATDEEELQPNYEGNVICQCCVCKQLIYKKPEDIVIDEETQNVNVGEECPHCYSTRGFKVIGQVEPYFDKDEVKVTVDDDEVTVEEDETEEVVESLNEAWEDGSEVEDFIGLKGTFRGLHPGDLKDMYRSWDRRLRRPTDPEEKEDYDELRSHYGETVEIIDVNQLNSGNSSAESFNNSYWEIEFKDGTSIAGIAGDCIDLYDMPNFGRSFKEAWEDAHKQFTYIVDHNIGKPGEIEKQIDALYATHKGEKDWDFAYRRWMEGSDKLTEDTVKQGSKWVNKGKEGTHGTFRTKKAADAQRKAMFAQGYKGESLKEDLDPAIVAKMDRESFINYAVTRKGWTEEEARDYLKTYFAEALDEPDIVLEEDDYTLDEKTGNISVDKQVFDDFVKDSYIRIHFNDDNDEESYTEYKMIEETDDAIVMEYLGGPYGQIDEALDDKITIEVTEEDINHFDEDTGDVIVDKTKFVGKDVQKGDYVTLKFTDETEDADTQDYKFVEETEDGFKLEWIGTKELHEDFQKATVETGSSILSMESDASGKVTVTSEPRKAEEGGDETITPVSDEVVAEIEDNNSEEAGEEEETTEEETTEGETTEEDTSEGESEEASEEEEVSVDEFEESYFNDLGKKYLQEVYNNVTSYETTKGSIDGKRIKLEGVISFKSGKKAKTEFYFEGYSVTKAGKIKLLGENAQITNKKNAFVLTGSINKGKLLAESLTYNYRAKDATTGKTVREYGTVKR